MEKISCPTTDHPIKKMVNDASPSGFAAPTSTTDTAPNSADNAVPRPPIVFGRFYHGLSADEMAVEMREGAAVIRDCMNKQELQMGEEPAREGEVGEYPASCWKWAILQSVGVDVACDAEWIEIMDVTTAELVGWVIFF